MLKSTKISYRRNGDVVEVVLVHRRAAKGAEGNEKITSHCSQGLCGEHIMAKADGFVLAPSRKGRVGQRNGLQVQMNPEGIIDCLHKFRFFNAPQDFLKPTFRDGSYLMS